MPKSLKLFELAKIIRIFFYEFNNLVTSFPGSFDLSGQKSREITTRKLRGGKSLLSLCTRELTWRKARSNWLPERSWSRVFKGGKLGKSCLDICNGRGRFLGACTVWLHDSSCVSHLISMVNLHSWVWFLVFKSAEVTLGTLLDHSAHAPRQGASVVADRQISVLWLLGADSWYPKGDSLVKLISLQQLTFPINSTAGRCPPVSLLLSISVNSFPGKEYKCL